MAPRVQATLGIIILLAFAAFAVWRVSTSGPETEERTTTFTQPAPITTLPDVSEPPQGPGPMLVPVDPSEFKPPTGEFDPSDLDPPGG